MRFDHLHARRDDGPKSYRAYSSASNRTQAVRSCIVRTAEADRSEHAGQSHAVGNQGGWVLTLPVSPCEETKRNLWRENPTMEVNSFSSKTSISMLTHTICSLPFACMVWTWSLVIKDQNQCT